MKLNNSVAAVVTGGASGLGEATARSLAAHGVKVAIFDFNAEKGEAVAKEIGGGFCKVDVTKDAEVEAGLARSASLLIAPAPATPSRPPSAIRKPRKPSTSRSMRSTASSRSTWSARSAASPNRRKAC